MHIKIGGRNDLQFELYALSPFTIAQSRGSRGRGGGGRGVVENRLQDFKHTYTYVLTVPSYEPTHRRRA